MASRRAPPALCRKCGREPRKPGQRIGKRCHAAYMRRWRRRQKQKQLDLLELIDQLREQLGWPA